LLHDGLAHHLRAVARYRQGADRRAQDRLLPRHRRPTGSRRVPDGRRALSWRACSLLRQPRAMTRSDLEPIVRWVAPGARVLDLGCGDGSLLRELWQAKRAPGYGVEIDEAGVLACL